MRHFERSVTFPLYNPVGRRRIYIPGRDFDGMKKEIVGALILLGLIFSVGFSWWNVSFPYCLPLNISTVEAGSPNSAMNLSVPFRTGMNPNFTDLRFINETCSGTGSELKYWNYFFNSSNVSLFYIDSSSLPASTVTNWSIYWGANVSSNSNLENLLYDNDGTRNVTVAQSGDSVVWATSAHGSYPASGVNDRNEPSAGYAGTWVTDTGENQILGIKLPWIFTVVKSGYQNPVSGYSVVGYYFRASYDNTTYRIGWKDSFANTQFEFFNSTVNFTNLPVTGQYFEFNISQDAQKGVGASEVYLFGFNSTSRITYALGENVSEWTNPNPEPEPVNGSLCVRVYATRPRFLWNQSEFSYFAGDYYENIIFPGASLVLNSYTNPTDHSYCSEYLGIIGNAKSCFYNISAPEVYRVSFHPNLNCLSPGPANQPNYTYYRLGDIQSIEGNMNASFVTAYSQPPVVENTGGIKTSGRIGNMFYEILNIGGWFIVGVLVVMSVVVVGPSNGGWVVALIVLALGVVIKLYISKWGL